MPGYIDVDKMKVDIKEIADITDGKLTEFEVLGIISAQPTADVRENVRGEWKIEYTGDGWSDYIDVTCTNCGKTIKRGEPYNYCPNCGADMRGEA